MQKEFRFLFIIVTYLLITINYQTRTLIIKSWFLTTYASHEYANIVDHSHREVIIAVNHKVSCQPYKNKKKSLAPHVPYYFKRCRFYYLDSWLHLRQLSVTAQCPKLNTKNQMLNVGVGKKTSSTQQISEKWFLVLNTIKY